MKMMYNISKVLQKRLAVSSHELRKDCHYRLLDLCRL